MNILFKPGQVRLVRKSVIEAVAELQAQRNSRPDEADRIRYGLECLAAAYDEYPQIVIWARIEREGDARVIPLFPGVEAKRVYDDLPVNLLASVEEEMYISVKTIPPTGSNLLFDTSNQVDDCLVGISLKRSEAMLPLTIPCAN